MSQNLVEVTEEKIEFAATYQNKQRRLLAHTADEQMLLRRKKQLVNIISPFEGLWKKENFES